MLKNKNGVTITASDYIGLFCGIGLVLFVFIIFGWFL
jgi:hypothetical protein